MSRPPFSLTDDQARELVQRVAPLLDRYPVDPRDHRPFLRAFLRVIHDVTHKLYGPDIYRRLLRAYAPGRNPSTPTIASERDALERELLAAAAANAAAAGPAPAGPALFPPASLAADPASLRALFDEYLPLFGRVAAQAGRDTQVDYLQGRLRDAERVIADTQSLAARLAADLAAQTARADLLAAELETSQAALMAQRAAVQALTDELKGQRLFSLQSIESARAETRLNKDRAAELQSKIDRLEMTIDQLRTARGAPGAPR
jgi:hypothetical protein